MNLTRFKELLDTYGADFRRWPVLEREEGQRLLQNSSDARTAHAEALQVDEALNAQQISVDAIAIARMRDAVRMRISCALTPEASTSSALKVLRQVPTSLSLRIGGLTAVALLGVLLGWTEPSLPAPDLFDAMQTSPLHGTHP